MYKKAHSRFLSLLTGAASAHAQTDLSSIEARLIRPGKTPAGCRKPRADCGNRAESAEKKSSSSPRSSKNPGHTQQVAQRTAKLEKKADEKSGLSSTATPAPA
jgi:sucrose porin